MKIHRFAVLAAFIASPAFSQTNIVATYLDILPQSNAGEGGELALFGSNGSGDIRIDNYFGNARIFVLQPGKQLQILGGTIYADGVGGANFFAGNVGIGTGSPAGRLDVSGVPDGGSVFFRSNGRPFLNIKGGANSYKSLRFSNIENDGDYRWDLNVFPGDHPTNPDGFGWWNASNGQVFTMKANGSVGFGTTDPDQKLTIKGGGIGFDHNSSDKKLYSPADGDLEWMTHNAALVHGFAVSHQGEKKVYLSTSGSSYFTGGNVGIGTTNPTHKLAVNGTIKAKEVIVETTGWSDYVFAEDYALAPLAEVEAHIKEHKHLPGIPSAAQVADHGISVGDMQARLLAKIEELTLHQIAQEKILRAQKQQLETQSKRINELETFLR
jgi:hypothetical protein